MPNADRPDEFAAWCAKHFTGDEKGQAQIFQIFLDRLFQDFGQSGYLDVRGSTEFRIRGPMKTLAARGPITCGTVVPGEMKNCLAAPEPPGER